MLKTRLNMLISPYDKPFRLLYTTVENQIMLTTVTPKQKINKKQTVLKPLRKMNEHDFPFPFL